MKKLWSNRLIDMCVNSYYIINGFPNWVEIAYKRYWSKYARWYGL